MNIAALNFNTIRNKKTLVTFYCGQFSEKYILAEINDILKSTRKSIPPGQRLFSKNISTMEVLIFINNNGEPDGYILSEEMKLKLKNLREELAREKALHRDGQKLTNKS